MKISFSLLISHFLNAVMLLAIDIGNTLTKFGLYDENALVRRMSLATIRGQRADEIFAATRFENLDAVVISSVVPELREAYRKFAVEFHAVEAVFVDNKFDFGLTIKYSAPENVGVDRLIAAFAAIEKYGAPCIIGDFGTATTIDAVNSEREYLGGVIVAGMNLLADALFQKTSQLPRVEVVRPEKVIGNSTVKAIQAGTYFGYVGLADGIIKRMADELGESPRVIATGGFASLIAADSEFIQTLDDNLLLDGLRLIYRRTTAIKSIGEIENETDQRRR